MNGHLKTTNATVAKIVNHIKLPKMVRVRQNFCRDKVENIPQAVRQELNAELLDRISPGDKIAITAGSREIANLAVIIKELVLCLKERGAEPFVVPAMGSHGGATAEGQADVLAGFGITEETMGVPIKSSMEVVQIATTPDGFPVNMDKFAYQADGIIVVARVKNHTSFRAPIESGLTKMVAVGLGKRDGAEVCHGGGIENLAARVRAVGETAIAHSKIKFALGIIENTYDETYKIKAVAAEKIIAEEPALLKEASALIPQILFDSCDVLVVEEAGKNIAGTGMDPNVIRTNYVDTVTYKPLAQRIALLDLTDVSHGNANGMTLADICTQRYFDKIDFSMTYPNSLTNGMLQSCKVPIVMGNDKLAMQAAIKGCYGIDHQNARLIRIKNTLSVGEMLISENLVGAAEDHPDIEVIGEAEEMQFDDNGNLIF